MDADGKGALGCAVVIVGGILLLNGLGTLDQWYGLPLCFAGGLTFWWGWIKGVGQ